jgi:hypothetical protein
MHVQDSMALSGKERAKEKHRDRHDMIGQSLLEPFGGAWDIVATKLQDLARCKNPLGVIMQQHCE